MLTRFSSGRKQVILDTTNVAFFGIFHLIQKSQIKSLQSEETNLIFLVFLDFHEIF